MRVYTYMLYGNDVDLSTVIPVFNEETDTPPLVDVACSRLEESPGYKIVVADAGSRDAAPGVSGIE